MNRSDWTVEQTVELFDRCAAARSRGESLTAVFAAVASATGRSVNSVRNYYYAQAKTFELVPDVAQKLGIKRASVVRDGFKPFTESEVRALIERIITEKAKGKSVRRAINEMADGDATLALRYQNKYRSALRAHRATVEEVMRELDARGVAYVDPYGTTGDNLVKLTEHLAALDERRIGKFLALIEKLI